MVSSDIDPDAGVEEVASSYDTNAIQLDDIYRQIKYEEHIKKSAELMLKALREEASEENDDELNETRDTTNVTAVLSATRLETGFRIGETNGQTERELREMKKSQLEQQVKEADEKIEMLKKQADLIQQLAQRMEEEKEDEQALYRNVSDTFGVDYYIQSNFPNDENLDPRQRALRHRDVIVVPKHYFMEEEEKTPLNDQIITTPVAQPSLPASVPEKLSDWHQASPTPSVETVSAQSLPIISSSQTNHTELPMDTLRLYHTTNPLPRKSSVSSIAPHTDVNALDDKMRPEFTACQELIEKLKAEPKLPKDRMDILCKLAQSLKSIRERKELLPIQDVLQSVRPSLNDRMTGIRAAAIRVVRYVMVDVETIKLLRQLRIDIFIVQTLTRDQRFEWEREQAIKLIRTCMELPNGASAIPESMTRALVAIAEQPDDGYRNICLETLCELAVHSVASVVKCGGMRVILSTLLDGHHTLSESLVLTLLYLLDAPNTRQYLRPGVDAEMVISCFTDGFSRGPTAIERLENASFSLKYMLRSWTGLLYLCANNFATIRSAVAGLNSPIEETRVAFLELVREVLELDNPINAVVDSNDPREQLLIRFAFRARTVRPKFEARADLMQQHLAAILSVLVEAGLIERLCGLIEKDNKSISEKAARLLADVLKLERRLLPAAYAIHVQSLPQLLNSAVSFEHKTLRSTATSTLHLIDHLTEEEIRQSMRPRKELVDKLQQSCIDMTSNVIDDIAFREALYATKVLTEQDGTKWDWDLIAELFTTTLRSPKYLDEALRGGHFMKRLLGFFSPTSGLPELPMTLNNMRYIRIGIDILDTLLQYPDGQRFLKDSDLLRKVAAYLMRMIPTTDDQEPVLTAKNTNRTLAWAYIWLLMSVSRTKEGHRALERANVFDTIYCLGQVAGREDVYREILKSMDYTLDGFPRMILSKMLTSESTSARQLATEQLRALVHENIPGFCDWGIRMLVDQLYDPDAIICQLAVAALDEACEVPENLEALIRLCPVLDHLGDVGRPIFFRFLSSPHGIQFILNPEQIYVEMDSWLEKNNIEYVAEIEMTLSSAFEHDYQEMIEPNPVIPPNLNARFERRCAMTRFRAKGIAPPHLYGALVRTPLGCELFRKKDHLDILSGVIHDWRNMLETPNNILKLKAALWAIGNIGASESGFAMLSESVVQNIVHIAEEAPVYSVRGTCFYVLGMLCKTQAGAELIEELGWLCSTTSYGRAIGICLPMDMQRFFTVPYWKREEPQRTISVSFYQDGSDAAVKEILTAVSNLTNHILANAGSKTLSRLKVEKPEYFSDMRLYLEVMRLMERSHFRLSARRFILDLFDINYNTAAFETLDAISADMQQRELIASFSETSGGSFEESKESVTTKSKQLNSPEPAPLEVPSDPKKRQQASTKRSTKQTLQPIVVIKGFLI